MTDQSRLFDAGPDPFGRMWRVSFRWLQVGITIRHADTIDVKFHIAPITANGEVDEAATEEKVIALNHPDLLKLVEQHGRKLTDPYCMRLAAAHIRRMIETSEDMDKTLVAVSYEDLLTYDDQLVPAGPRAR